MRFTAGVSVIFTLLFVLCLGSLEANASATGCDNRQESDEVSDPNAISVDIKHQYGYLCHLIHTRGKQISEQKASYTESAGIYAPLIKDVCNWRIDFVYYDSKGDEYMRDEGETVTDCKKGARRDISKSKTLSEYGTTCAKLFIDGKPRLTQCHTISE